MKCWPCSKVYSARPFFPYRPAPLLKKLVVAGFLAETSWLGFYSHDEGQVRLMREALIVEAVRTPMGCHGGILEDFRTDDLGAYIIAKLVEKNRH